VPPGASPDQVSLGERIFHGQADGATCAGCHGADAKGSTVGSDLADGHFLWGDGSVHLSEADLAAVADYVWAISHQNKNN
jgi:mono/diheme cytochrome c family protein